MRFKYRVVPEDHVGTPDRNGRRCFFAYAIRRPNGELVFRTQTLEQADYLVGSLIHEAYKAEAT